RPQPRRNQQWLRRNATTAEPHRRWEADSAGLTYRPLISIVTPIYNTPERWLRRAIESVQAQIYPHWQLCLADDASTDLLVSRVLSEYARLDDRIKVVALTENSGISGASNAAPAAATGQFGAMLDH